ncbi:XdhC family protein [Streptomyces sp. NPDC090994]|uniref:XdhC family protein n=1 Tax=Streptomyces sp. NPDC090994 TaxID=3365969 RepID=UPI00380E610C
MVPKGSPEKTAAPGVWSGPVHGSSARSRWAPPSSSSPDCCPRSRNGRCCRSSTRRSSGPCPCPLRCTPNCPADSRSDAPPAGSPGRHPSPVERRRPTYPARSPRFTHWCCEHRPFAPAAIVSVTGSAPLPVGSSLAVDEDGTAVGSVSGRSAKHPLLKTPPSQRQRTAGPPLWRRSWTDQRTSSAASSPWTRTAACAALT